MKRSFRLPVVPAKSAEHPTIAQSVMPSGGKIGPDSDDWGRLPVAIAKKVFFIFCPNCEESVKSPFSGLEIWTIPDVTIRKFQKCEHCGTRFRVKFI